MQIIYISNRPKRLIETIGHVEKYMPFISEGIIVAPSKQHVYFNNFKCRIPFSIISEEDITQQANNFHDLDHQSKNFFLRTNCAKQLDVRPEFIMSDDDARPLRIIDEAYYRQDGRYHNYFYYDLARWRYGFNDFDIGQQNTYQVLKHLGMPHLSYASHMPQIINKKIFLDMSDQLSAFSRRNPVCEWSTYFNFGLHHYPDKFQPPRPFQTLCWPEQPASWPRAVDPALYSFENYSPDLYKQGAPFHMISSTYDPKQQDDNNLDKILKWYRYELKCLNPLCWNDLDQTPYTFWKKLLLFSLIPIRKAHKHIAWEKHENSIKFHNQ